MSKSIEQLEVLNAEFSAMSSAVDKLKVNISGDSDAEELKRSCSEIEASAYKIAACARAMKLELNKEVIDQREELRKFWEESA